MAAKEKLVFWVTSERDGSTKYSPPGEEQSGSTSLSQWKRLSSKTLTSWDKNSFDF